MTKRKSIISVLISCCIMLASLFVFAACGEDKPHEHEFAQKWSSNAQYHWHASTCGHDDTVEKEAHDTPRWQSNAAQHWLACPTCGYEFSDRADHVYENESYECKDCHRISEEATILVTTDSGEITYYGEFSQAVINKEEVKAGSTIVLLKDVTITKYISVVKNLTIDFGGHTVTAYNEDSGQLAGGIDLSYGQNGENAGTELTLLNGTLKTQKWGVWVQNAGKLTVGKDFTIHANTAHTKAANAITVVEPGSTINIDGTCEVEGEETICISGNGTSGKGNVTININDGAVITGSEIGVYMPNTGYLNIGKATIESKTAVYIKAGNVTIDGATLIATGAPTEYVCREGGATATGDAIVVDSMGYPGGTPVLTLIDADITTEEGCNAIVGYAINGNSYIINNNVTTKYNVVEVARNNVTPKK